MFVIDSLPMNLWKMLSSHVYVCQPPNHIHYDVSLFLPVISWCCDLNCHYSYPSLAVTDKFYLKLLLTIKFPCIWWEFLFSDFYWMVFKNVEMRGWIVLTNHLSLLQVFIHFYEYKGFNVRGDMLTTKIRGPRLSS